MLEKAESLKISSEFLVNSVSKVENNIFLNIANDQTLITASDIIADYYTSICAEIKPLSQIKMSEINKDQIQLVNTYGIYWIKQYFQPHVTLSYEPINNFDIMLDFPIQITFD